MPELQTMTLMARKFTDKGIETLRWGHIPHQMEDKWFYYMEGETLFIHRSWTGNCIFILEVDECYMHRLTVNRDPSQYTNIDLAKDVELLNGLLDVWTRPFYDPYTQWLDETIKRLEAEDQSR